MFLTSVPLTRTPANNPPQTPFDCENLITWGGDAEAALWTTEAKKNHTGRGRRVVSLFLFPHTGTVLAEKATLVYGFSRGEREPKMDIQQHPPRIVGSRRPT